MKYLLFLAMALSSIASHAIPTLTSSPYSVATTQPSLASLSVDGTSTIVCTVPKD